MSDTPEEPTQLADSENPHAAEFAVLAALQTENAELKDQRLRALAEMENVRRIAAREKADASQYAVTKFAREMLDISTRVMGPEHPDTLNSMIALAKARPRPVSPRGYSPSSPSMRPASRASCPRPARQLPRTA